VVVNGVEHLDDHALALDGVGDVDMGVVDVEKRFGQECLAVSGLAVDEERLA
jgi:hypothetical protein